MEVFTELPPEVADEWVLEHLLPLERYVLCWIGSVRGKVNGDTTSNVTVQHWVPLTSTTGTMYGSQDLFLSVAAMDVLRYDEEESTAAHTLHATEAWHLTCDHVLGLSTVQDAGLCEGMHTEPAVG